MKGTARLLAAALLVASRPALAQCPDGTPPPCGGARSAPLAPRPNSVAVLPFENRARDTSLTLLAEGLADQITTNLGQVQRLALTPPASVRGGQRCASSPPVAPIGPLALACAGRATAARALLDSMVVQVERGDYYYHPAWIALMFVGMGDTEAALRWLERGIEARTYILVFARVDPMWDPLRSDPRFASVLERIRPEGR